MQATVPSSVARQVEVSDSVHVSPAERPLQAAMASAGAGRSGRQPSAPASSATHVPASVFPSRIVTAHAAPLADPAQAWTASGGIGRPPCAGAQASGPESRLVHVPVIE